MREIGDKGIDLILGFEKDVLEVYDDGFGYPTAGVGHRLSAAELAEMPIGSHITRKQSRDWFRSDLAKYAAAVDKAVKVHISQNQFDALVSLCFNIGTGAFAKASLVRALNRGDYAGCADGILAWNKVKGKPVRGLTRRRQAERSLFHTPDSAAASTGEDVPEPLAGEPAPNTPAGGTPTQSEPPPSSTPVVVEKEENVGFFAGIKKKIAGWIASFGGLTAVHEYKQQLDDLGIPTPPAWVIKYTIEAIVAAFAGWLLYQGVMHLWRKIASRWLTVSLISANATPTNSVSVACAADLNKYAAQGFKVIPRQ